MADIALELSKDLLARGGIRGKRKFGGVLGGADEIGKLVDVRPENAPVMAWSSGSAT
jgi:hypothetical protein